MHDYSDDIQTDITSQYAVHVEKVNDSCVKPKIKKAPTIENNVSKKMSKAMLEKKLKLLQLNTFGSKKVLSKRLEMYNNKKGMSKMCEKVMFDFYVVIDYEATCDKNQKNFDTNNQEIIEFPAVLLNCHTGEVEDEFQFYCRPVVNPLLTDYCIKLTGITQDVVDKAPLFHEVLDSFNIWLQKKKLGSEYSFAIVTDGSKDIGHFLKNQCVLSQVDFPEYCQYWVNIREAFSLFYRIKNLQYLARVANDTVLNTMIKEIGYEFQGKAHSGLDDARNIAFLAQCLLQDGASLIFNEKVLGENQDKKKKSSFSTPVSQKEFEKIHDTFKPNFPANNSSDSLKALDTKTVTKAVAKTVAKDVLGKDCTKESTAKPLVKGVVKIPIIECKSANTEVPKKTKAKKNLPPTKDIVKIPTKVNPTKNPSKVVVEENLVQREIKQMSTKDSLLKNPSKEIKASGKAVSVIPAQSSVKSALPGTSSAQNSKPAAVLKEELSRARKNFYRKCDNISPKEAAQLKKHIGNLKKLLEAARSREDQSSAKEEKAVLVKNLDLTQMKEFEETQAIASVPINSKSVKKNRSEKVEKLKSKVNQQSVVKAAEQKLSIDSNRGFAALEGNLVIGNSASVKVGDEEERLFFEDFENLLTMKVQS